MRSASAGLITLLNQFGPLVWADLFTITFPGDTPTYLRYTSHDQPITYDGKTWALGPLIARGSTKLSIGVSVDTLDVTITGRATDTINGVPLMSFIARGGLDGARLTLERVFAANWSTAPAGTVLLFSGRISEVDMDRYEARLTIRSDLEVLDVKVPRNLYQPGCLNTLFDNTCGLARTAHTVTRTASGPTGSTQRQFNYTRVHAHDGTASYYGLGVVKFLTGANAGISRTVKVHSVVDASNAALQAIAPWPFAVASGDTFTLSPGCDKTKATCTSKFANVIRFRGTPYIPVPETVV
jgi:uncharacterized phage protein (TIGR02218 family)